MTSNSVDANSRLTPVDDNYETCERTCVVLRIYCGSTSPSTVTNLLGLEPTSQVVLGEPGRLNSLGRAPLGKLNGWFISSEGRVKSKDTRPHLDWLLSQLQGSSAALRELQSKSDVRISVNVVWWSRYGDGGPTLWPEQMRGLAELHLECSFDFAAYGDGLGEAPD